MLNVQRSMLEAQNSKLIAQSSELFHSFHDLRIGVIQNLYQLVPVKYTVFKGLRHFDRIRRAGYDTEIAHRAELQVIDQFVNGLFLPAIRLNIKFGDHFDGTVRAGDLAGLATCTPVFIVLVVRHHHLAFEPFGQFQGITVVGVLLGDDLFVMRKIIQGTPHTYQQRSYRAPNIFYVFACTHIKNASP